MKANRVNRRRLYQQVADDLEEHILDGTYATGTRLPGEHELADSYSVSRNVIREALKRLKEHGLVVIRTGSGVYVCQPTTKPVSDALNRLLKHVANDVSIVHFCEIRRIIEPESARLAAERAEPNDLRTIEAALHGMEAHQDDSQAWSKADLEFHLAIASATHNPLIQSILYPLTNPLRTVIAAGHSHPQNTEAGLEAHHHIFDAIQNRDCDRAFQAMLEHLLDSEQRLSRVGIQMVKETDTDKMETHQPREL